MIYLSSHLHIYTFGRMFDAEETSIPPSSSSSIPVAALIFGKAVVVADILPLINRFPNKPLIYNVAWKTSLSLCCFLLSFTPWNIFMDFWRRRRFCRPRQ